MYLVRKETAWTATRTKRQEGEIIFIYALIR
jgi:hypothetical protein